MINKFLKRIRSFKSPTERSIYRLENLKKEIDEYSDYKLTDYVFEMLLLTCKEDIVIEITFPSHKDKCHMNAPNFKVNGKAIDYTPYHGNISESLRKAYESYQLEE